MRRLLNIAALNLVLMIAAGRPVAQTISGYEILERVDANLVSDRAVSVSTMIIHGRGGKRTITSKAWTRGEDSTLVEYLSPAREEGKKMLRLGDKIWNYIPEPSDRIITISGHLLKQSVMGSDLSYEDITENHNLRDLYDAVVLGTDSIDGRACWKLELTANHKRVAYYSRHIWVDQERWLPIREERFARSGRLLKTTRITEAFNINGRWYPRRMIFNDELSRSRGTEFIIESIDFEVEIPDHLMTKAALRR
jgi:outer membrane lipoprotein-sorting protein